MIQEVKVPEISENVESGEVINILVQIGDAVKVDQPLVELETEKAAFEVPSTVQGQVVELLVKTGEKVRVGQVILKIETEAKGDIKKKIEQPVTKAQQSESEKYEEPAPSAAEYKRQEPEGEVEPEPETKQSGLSVPAAPSVRQLARELGIDIAQINGSGPGGRISDEDVKKHAKNIITSSKVSARPASAIQAGPLPDFSKWGPTERKPASATRKKIAETMSSAWSQVAHVTQQDQADITNLRELIAEYADAIKQAGGKLTMTSIMIKAAAMALSTFPELNASYDAELNEIIYKRYVHISVAVETDRGLIVPVIRDADKKNIKELSVELSQLADKARQHKTSPDEMLGGTFTITNLGGIGGTSFSPIVYWPQTAILGISRAVRQPVYSENKLEPRWMLPLSLSYDHRIIDGAQGIRFLRAVIDLLEKPFLLILKENEHVNRQ